MFTCSTFSVLPCSLPAPAAAPSDRTEASPAPAVGTVYGQTCHVGCLHTLAAACGILCSSSAPAHMQLHRCSEQRTHTQGNGRYKQPREVQMRGSYLICHCDLLCRSLKLCQRGACPQHTPLHLPMQHFAAGMGSHCLFCELIAVTFLRCELPRCNRHCATKTVQSIQQRQYSARPLLLCAHVHIVLRKPICDVRR